MSFTLRVLFTTLATIGLFGCGPTKATAPAPATVDYDVEAVVGTYPDASGEFFPGTKYSPEISTPEQILGHPVGALAVRHADILKAFESGADGVLVAG